MDYSINRPIEGPDFGKLKAVTGQVPDRLVDLVKTL